MDISFSCEPRRISNGAFPSGDARLLCRRLLMSTVQQLEMCLAHKGVSELIRCCMQAGWCYRG